MKAQSKRNAQKKILKTIYGKIGINCSESIGTAKKLNYTTSITKNNHNIKHCKRNNNKLVIKSR